MSLLQQKIMIVGGSSGIGLASAQRLAQAGAQVIIVGRSQARLNAALDELKSKASAYVADFTDAASLKALFEASGPIDHLVLTASSEAAWGPFAVIDADTLRRALDAKLIGYWLTLQAALLNLRRDGSVVMLSGAASRTAMPGMAGLAAVNGGITQMAQTLARELAPLRINVISPGLVDTPAYDDMPADAKIGMFQGMASTLPVGRTGKPGDIARAVEFLIENSFTTGALIDVDGGAALL